MIRYNKRVVKAIEKGDIPLKIAQSFYNIFVTLDQTKDFNMFDIKKLKSCEKILTYRLRKGRYRAIFRLLDESLDIMLIGKREEVYKLWEQLQSD